MSSTQYTEYTTRGARLFLLFWLRLFPGLIENSLAGWAVIRVKSHVPTACTWICAPFSGSPRWRRSSSSYWLTVFSKSLKISSAAAVSLSLMNSLTGWREDMISAAAAMSSSESAVLRSKALAAGWRFCLLLSRMWRDSAQSEPNGLAEVLLLRDSDRLFCAPAPPSGLEWSACCWIYLILFLALNIILNLNINIYNFLFQNVLFS